MIQSIENNVVTCRCTCGTEFKIKTTADVLNPQSIYGQMMLSVYKSALCTPCAEKKKAELAAEREKERLAELAESLIDRETKAGFPGRFRGLEKPFVRNAALFFWEHQNDSVIVTGKTGTGKTSSALYVLGLLMAKRELNVAYYTRQTLFASYAQAKRSTNDSEEAFLYRLGFYDYIVLDELVGKKGDSALSDSAQELLFNLIDGVYSGTRKAKLWILGNFYRGAIDGLVADPDPYKRRIRECFAQAIFKYNFGGTEVIATPTTIN